MKRACLLCILSLSGCLLFPVRATHAQGDDWLAWHGCWQADGAPAGEYLCIVPDGAAGVRMATVVHGGVVAESRVVTDGRPRRVQTEGCSGSEIAFWSGDYHRVFLSSDLSCETGVTRRASGVFVVTGEAAWMSIQAVTIDERTATRTVNYTAVDDAVAPASLRALLPSTEAAREAARAVALSPVDANDVTEAVDRIDAAAVQEWLTATGQPFQLADELAPAADDAVMRSALDHTGSYTPERPAREVVHVVDRPVEIVHVERPVYITHTHVYPYRYRTCWDPFFSGSVLGVSHGVRRGIGHASCGRSDFTHYSPWGYDLFGWRFVHVRPIIVAGRPIIHYREPRRPPRYVGTTRRDDVRRTTDPRTTVRGRAGVPVRTARPRDASATTRTVQSLDPLPTFGGRTAGRVTSRETTASTPGRYAQRRTPAATTSRPVPVTGVSSRVKSAEPRRTAVPPRVPVLPRREPRSVMQTPTRVAEPRASSPARLPASPSRSAAPPSRSASPERVTQPRVFAPTREPAPSASSRARSSTRPTREQEAASSSSRRSSGGAPARMARPRGGEERSQ